MPSTEALIRHGEACGIRGTLYVIETTTLQSIGIGKCPLISEIGPVGVDEAIVLFDYRPWRQCAALFRDASQMAAQFNLLDQQRLACGAVLQTLARKTGFATGGRLAG